jgi:hypothetical protein
MEKMRLRETMRRRRMRNRCAAFAPADADARALLPAHPASCWRCGGAVPIASR